MTRGTSRVTALVFVKVNSYAPSPDADSRVDNARLSIASLLAHSGNVDEYATDAWLLARVRSTSEIEPVLPEMYDSIVHPTPPAAGSGTVVCCDVQPPAVTDDLRGAVLYAEMNVSWPPSGKTGVVPE